MPIYRLPRQIVFPDPSEAEPDGLLAVGGDLGVQRLLSAYAQGIFPWPHEGFPLLWFSPDPRTVLLPAALHISRSLQRTLNKQRFDIRFDTDFVGVMQACATTPRPGQDGTWISDDMIDAYSALHELGFAHSVEAWCDGVLVGGLYGISLGAAFFGESMFARCPDASKVALVHLVRRLQGWDFHVIDCQMPSRHLTRLGAVEWPRCYFLQALKAALSIPTRQGRWT